MLACGIGEWNDAGLRQQQCNRPRKMVDNGGAMGKGESKYWETHRVPTGEARLPTCQTVNLNIN